MRLVGAADALAEQWRAVERLATKSFSVGGTFLEKYIENARHIEVQIFGDGAGEVVAMGERDCSTQRRNQKVVEETPAPGISAATRQALQAAAWGEPVPKSEGDEKKLAQKGSELLEKYHEAKGDKPKASAGGSSSASRADQKKAAAKKVVSKKAK